ncbi:MAG TPA: neprosin family prolyl endopeptidase [Thermoanaerobaculia bacterium]
MKPTAPLLLAAALLVACNSTRPPATPGSGSFPDFIAATRAATPDAYVGREGFAVANAAELGRMQTHLATLYEGVTSSRTVRDAAGTTFDCIPIEQQPGLRGGEPLLTPRTPALTFNDAGETGPRGAKVQPNSVGCGAGTIPMRRITLEQIARFRTIDEFLTGNKRYPVAGAVNIPGIHYYATVYQDADAYGAGTDINIWAPYVVPGADVFSLSQLWVAGGADAARQTVEAGWTVYPMKFGTAWPVLFEYWTPDDYASGCYNLECPGFVQTNRSWVFGAVVGPISQLGGTQTTLQYAWWRDSLDGVWWLYLGHGTLQAVGYIPKRMWNAGQMSKYATRVMFGGETATNTPGVPAGHMGNGNFAAAGPGYAAFQNKLTYYPTTGGIVPLKATAMEPTPQCYTVLPTSGMERSFMYFGGPQCPP